MKKRMMAVLLVLSLVFLCGCSLNEGGSGSLEEGGSRFLVGGGSGSRWENSPGFRITFIDVGQGDAALIECDGHNMLIDAGNVTGAKAVTEVLEERNVERLDILVASHLHEDHIGGMKSVLNSLENKDIDWVLSNSNYGKTNVARDFITDIENTGNRITVPEVDKTFELGSAEVKVLFNRNEKENDSLVLLITYKEATFLFTGDIQKDAHSIVAEKLRDMSSTLDLKNKTNLIKMPHHGAYNSDPSLPDNSSDNSLRALIDADYSNYFVISVGKNNRHKHPDPDTLKIITQASGGNLYENKYFFRTDECGNITVEVDPNGCDLRIETEGKEH